VAKFTRLQGQYLAFFGTILGAFFRWNGIRTIVFVGIDGDVGGVQTLMLAWYLGYFRVAVSDGILASSRAGTAFATTYLSDSMPRTHQEVMDIWKKYPSRPRP
jgi:nicotinamidase-related amidase